MASDEKLKEARRLAEQILALRDEDVSRIFYDEMKKRQLGKLVRSLDRLVLAGGEDRKAAEAALTRLGFAASG